MVTPVSAQPLLSPQLVKLLLDALDKDRDGLWNWWETNGVDINLDGIIDLNLPGLGAKVDHKDLFIEIDYMTFHKPIDAAKTMVINKFANADVSNPDGTKGINLHILVDEQISHTNTINEAQLLAIKATNFGTSAERSNLNYLLGILPAKLLVYHYGIFGHDQPSPFTGSSGNSFRIPNMDFVVTLGVAGAAQTAGHNTGNDVQQAATLMHEFGHNLGLHHGGSDDINCKPNYLSIMNYLFQFPSLVAGRPLDYSRSAVNVLDENSLNEQLGVTTSDPSGLKTVYSSGFPDHIIDITDTGIPIDWDWSGSIDNINVGYNINTFPAINDCAFYSADKLVPFDDWVKIKYRFNPIIDSGLGAQIQKNMGNRSNLFKAFNNTYTIQNSVKPTPMVTPEITFAEVRDMTISLAKGIDLAIQTTPSINFKTPASSSSIKKMFSQEISSDRPSGSVILSIKGDNADDAITKLKIVRGKMDGRIGGNLANDEITSIKAQQNIVPMIDNLISVLQQQK